MGRRSAWRQAQAEAVRRVTDGVTFDAGALIALDRNDRRVVAIVERARSGEFPITVPATALAQAIRRPERQARLARLLRQRNTEVVALDRVDAQHVGRLLRASGTTDVVDAHVVICAQRARQAIVTSDRDDLRRLDPTLTIVAV